MKDRSSRLRSSGEGCGSTLLGCIIISCALTFVLIVLLTMVPQVRGFVRDLVVRVVGQGIQRVTIPEGWNRYQVASRLANLGAVSSDAAFLEATEDPALLETLDIPGDSAEGYLFPDTYDLYRASEPEDIVEKLVSNYRKKFRDLSRRHTTGLRRLSKLGDDPEHVAVILASVVEKEAVEPGERPLIAGVFLNRLLIAKFPSRLLQADPTVSYGCIAVRPRPASCKGFDGHLARSHLDDETNQYNTYLHPGLPPGPISNPGLGALEAVLDPEDTKYLYFVARGNGMHQFSATLDEHKAAVKKYRDGD